MAALLQGQSVSSVAKEYKIPKGTVSSWKRKAQGEGVGPDTTQKKQIGNLLVEYLEANLQALRVQAEAFADKDWLATQDAASLATLHGVMTDKAVRLIEAFGQAEGDDDSD